MIRGSWAKAKPGAGHTNRPVFPFDGRRLTDGDGVDCGTGPDRAGPQHPSLHQPRLPNDRRPKLVESQDVPPGGQPVSTDRSGRVTMTTRPTDTSVVSGSQPAASATGRKSNRWPLSVTTLPGGR